MEIIKFISVLALTWLFVEGAASVKFFKDLANIGPDSNPSKTWLMVAKALVNCGMCSGFWIGLIVYHDIYMASLTSVCADLFGRFINKLNSWM